MVLLLLAAAPPTTRHNMKNEFILPRPKGIAMSSSAGSSCRQQREGQATAAADNNYFDCRNDNNNNARLIVARQALSNSNRSSKNDNHPPTFAAVNAAGTIQHPRAAEEAKNEDCYSTQRSTTSHDAMAESNQSCPLVPLRRCGATTAARDIKARTGRLPVRRRQQRRLRGGIAARRRAGSTVQLMPLALRIPVVALGLLLLLAVAPLAARGQQQQQQPTEEVTIAPVPSPTQQTPSPTASPLAASAPPVGGSVPSLRPTAAASGAFASSPAPTAGATADGTSPPAPTAALTGPGSLEPTPPPATDAPTSAPTPPQAQVVTRNFQQGFIVPDTTFFNDNQTNAMMSLFAGYTYVFSNATRPQVNASCEYRPPQRFVQEDTNVTTYQNTLDYSCMYSSFSVDVSTYPEQYVAFVNANLRNVTLDLRALALPITVALSVTAVLVSSDPPVGDPTDPPSVSPRPSGLPTVAPSARPKVPTMAPTRDYEAPPDELPAVPTAGVVPGQPSTQPPPQGPRVSVLAIAIIVVLGGVAILIGLVVYYRRRVKQRQALRVPRVGVPVSNQVGGVAVEAGDILITDGGVTVVHPSGGSPLSGKSLLSEGDDGLDGDSDNDVDNTKNLLDEFDQYKDQNLEQLRSEVECNLPGFEGVMSAAVTKALMADEDIPTNDLELCWGCEEPATGAEIEASVLCDVCDWMKRNEGASAERKNLFMQELLNRMVASVRHSKILAEDASRAIQESAALLQVELENDLPYTTVIVSGMRRTVEANQIVKVLDEFGDIDTVAVASGGRGFGIVRFRTQKSVDRALRRYRSGEIVVEDVAILLKVLMPSGEVVSRV